MYYVYTLTDPRDDTIFYVGQGKGDRAYTHQEFKDGCNNRHKDRVIRKILACNKQVKVDFLETDLTKDQAILLETQTIEQIGLDNLTNICVGNNPPVKYGLDNNTHKRTLTEDQRKKIGDANRGKDTKSQSGKKSIGDAMRKRWQDPEFRAKMAALAAARKGEKRKQYVRKT